MLQNTFKMCNGDRKMATVSQIRQSVTVSYGHHIDNTHSYLLHRNGSDKVWYMVYGSHVFQILECLFGLTDLRPLPTSHGNCNYLADFLWRGTFGLLMTIVRYYVQCYNCSTTPCRFVPQKIIYQNFSFNIRLRG